MELVSIASAKLSPDKTVSSHRNFLPKQMKLEAQWEVEVWEIACPSVYQKVTEGKFSVFDTKLSNSTDPFVDKILFFSRIKLSKSQTLILHGVEIGVLFPDSALKLRQKNADVPNIYFIWLDTAGNPPSLVLNHNAKTEERGSCSHSQSDPKKLQKVYTQGPAAYGPVRNLSETSLLPPSKTRQFLHSKTSYTTKYTVATRNHNEWRFFLGTKMKLVYGFCLCRGTGKKTMN